MGIATPSVRCRDHLDVSVGATAAAAGARGFRRVGAAFFVLQAGGTLPIPVYVLWPRQIASDPTTLVFWLYLAALVPVALAVLSSDETVARRGEIVLGPRAGLPPRARG